MRAEFSISAVFFATVLHGCGGGRGPAVDPAPARTSQLLITIEAVAPRHLSPFGGPRAMPALAAIAEAGTIYDDAMSTTPVARPALVTILTGVSPDRSGVRDSIHDALPASASIVSQQARDSGFDTAAFVSTPFASYSSGLQRGFDLFDGPEESVIGPSEYRPDVVPAATVADHFKQWLGTRDRTKPFFAWIHLADLNGLATPPPGNAGSAVPKSGDPLEDYDKALGSLDDAIGAIGTALKNDPAAKDCGVTIVGTHGVYLGGDGRRGDAFWLADETLRIPVVRVAHLSAAAAQQPRHDPRPTWLPDVAASLRAAFGARPSGDQEGVPLEQAPPAGRLRLAWTYAPDDQLAWPPLTAVIEGSTISVFSASSTGGLVPVGAVTATASTAAAARAALPRPRVLTDALRESALKAGVKLGAGKTAPSMPKNPDIWLRDLQVDRVFLANKRQLLAARMARRMLDDAPDAFAVLLVRLFILSGGPSQELTELRDKLLDLYPERSEALHWAAHVSFLTQDHARSAALLDTAIAIGPVEPEVYYDRACVHVLSGETKLGLAALQTALKAGYRNWEWMDKDPDLAAIRSNPDFLALLRAHGR